MNECGANGRFSMMARASTKALRSDIELQSVLRYRRFNSRCANGEVHIDRLGVNEYFHASCSFECNEDNLSVPVCRFIIGESAECAHRLKAGNLQHEQ
jgi:hypothetical protein